MPIRSLRLCHHCCLELSEDEVLHYVFECHACVMSEHDLAAAVRRDPGHPDAERLAGGPVETSHGSSSRGARETRTRALPRRRAA